MSRPLHVSLRTALLALAVLFPAAAATTASAEPSIERLRPASERCDPTERRCTFPAPRLGATEGLDRASAPRDPRPLRPPVIAGPFGSMQ